MIQFGRIVTTGIETLASLGFGFAAAALGLLSPPASAAASSSGANNANASAAAVDALNSFVVRCCLPCLQLWLLASRADLRAPGAWAALAAFSVWTILLFASAALFEWWRQGPRGRNGGTSASSSSAAAAQQLLRRVLQQARGRGGPAAAAAAAAAAAWAPPPPELAAAAAAATSAADPPTTTAAAAVAARGRFRPARLALHCLVLATNNTGVLGPVVLEAALGREYAPLGPMATVALYFLQLPLAQALLSLEQQQRRRGGAGSERRRRRIRRRREDKVDGSDEGGGVEMTTAAAHPKRGEEIEAATTPVHAALGGLLRARAEDYWDRSVAEARVGGFPAGAAARSAAQAPAKAPHATTPPAATSQILLDAVVRNPLVWCTGVAVVLSLLGSPRVLNPALAGGGGGGEEEDKGGSDVAVAIAMAAAARLSVAWIDGFLGWFARCAAPVSLFATGAWMRLWQQQQQMRGEREDGAEDDGDDDNSNSSDDDDDSDDESGIDGDEHEPLQQADAEQQQQQRSSRPRRAPNDHDHHRRCIAAYLALRATVAPAAMALVCAALRVPGRDLRAACVCLSLLPVAQTSFAVARDSGASRLALATIATAMVASVVLLLPQLVATLWLFDRLGWLGGK